MDGIDGIPRRLPRVPGSGGCRALHPPPDAMTLPGPASLPLTIEAASARIHGLERAIGKVIVGQHELVRRLLTGLFAAIPYSFAGDEVRTGCGHVLLEGVPGVA